MKSLIALSLALVLALAANAHALTKCSVKVVPKTGVIQVSAAGVSGPLRWGAAPGAESRTFANEGTCIDGTKATLCEVGVTSPTVSAEAIIAPELCTIYLSDGSATCSARIKGCTAGLRSAGPDTRFGRDTSAAAAPSSGFSRECNTGEVWLVAGVRAGPAAMQAAGQILPIANFTELYSLIQNTYGGDVTQNTFALPDLRGAAPNGLTYVICVDGTFP